MDLVIGIQSQLHLVVEWVEYWDEERRGHVVLDKVQEEVALEVYFLVGEGELCKDKGFFFLGGILSKSFLWWIIHILRIY